MNHLIMFSVIFAFYYFSFKYLYQNFQIHEFRIFGYDHKILSIREVLQPKTPRTLTFYTLYRGREYFFIFIKHYYLLLLIIGINKERIIINFFHLISEQFSLIFISIPNLGSFSVL